MTVQEINNLLSKNYDSLALWANTKGNNQWEYVPKGKWTAGQHVLHLTQSTKPLIKGLSTPKILLKYRFGKCNRPIRTYEEVVSKYHTKLERLGNVVSPFSQQMPAITKGQKDSLLNELRDLNSTLAKKSLKILDKNLDIVLLPHPLMGKMTLREILMWNAYHLQHHTDILVDKYS